MLVTAPPNEWTNQTGSAVRPETGSGNQWQQSYQTNFFFPLFISWCDSHVPNTGLTQVPKSHLRRQEVKCSLAQNKFTNSNKIHNLSNAKKRCNDERPAARPLQESRWSFFLHDLAIKMKAKVSATWYTDF